MFESRLQAVQFCLAGSILSLVVAILVLWLGPLVVGVFFLLVQAAAAAVGCALYADLKGHPLWLGLAVGVGLGPVGALLILILPDQSDEPNVPDRRRRERSDRRRRPRRRRRNDPGYEVLDPDPSPYD